MQIREIFATTVQERIEPVVKVADRSPMVVQSELSNLVVTPQWERYLHRILDAYTDAADRENEQGVGIWISGFFGSGKSLLMKMLGVLLENGQLQNQTAHELFLSRLPVSSPERADLSRFLNICRRKVSTTAIGGNLHAMLANADDHLALIAFKLFAAHQGYTHNWSFAWTVEYQIDARGQSQAFRTRAETLAGVDWAEMIVDPEFYLDALYQAAADTLPQNFPGPDAVERAVNAIVRNGVTPNMVIERLRRWCEVRDTNTLRHKLLLQLDELGQWIASGNQNERIMQVQALVEEAAERGGGRLWLAVTAHGDVQALKSNVQQEQYAKIIQRFGVTCKLSNDDINQVVEERVLRKTQAARQQLEQRFAERSGDLSDLGGLEQTQRVYPAPDAQSFARFYPYMPWTVAVVPDVVKGIAQTAKRDEALSGSNRTMIGVVQGALIETQGLLASPVGKLIHLADLYNQLASDVPIETKTDLNRIEATTPDGSPFTTQVARGLFLLGQAEYIGTTLNNVTRTVVDQLDANFTTLRKRVKTELDRLVQAGYAKQVGEHYVFLSTQQRTFQEKVRARQDELLSQTADLIQALKEYEGDDALRFDRVALHEREMTLRLELDGRMVRNPVGAHVLIRVLSPLQRALDPQIRDDSAMRQRSLQEPDTIFLRMGEVQGLRAKLAQAAATDEVANAVLSARQVDSGAEQIARQARQDDLPTLKVEVRRLLAQAVREGVIFFRGTLYQLGAGDRMGEAVRSTLSAILPIIFPRFPEVMHRIVNDQTAVKAALSGNTNHPDLQELGVYKTDATLNESHPLISTLRGRLPLVNQDLAPVNAAELRNELERPPFGWDGNGVKVGLALLLRAAACRLIDNGRPITDPSDPQALELLSKEMAFRNLRVQGVRADITMPELIELRNAVQQIFGLAQTPPLVQATLNNILGEQLSKLAERAQVIQAWATLAQCPLPVAFQTGASLTNELLNLAAPATRLRTFGEQRAPLTNFIQALALCERFRQEQGALFNTVRDFSTSMVNASVDLPALRQFLADYRVVIREQSVTEPTHWQALTQAYHAAQQAVTDQIATWRAQVENRLATVNAELENAVRAVGVPEEQVRDEAAALSMLYDPVRTQIEQDARHFGETRALLTTLTQTELEKETRLRELRERYRVHLSNRPVHLRWQALTSDPVQIETPAALEMWLEQLRQQITAYLASDQTVIIE